MRTALTDGFVHATLQSEPANVGATALLLSGIGTQSCVTHTAISTSIEKYEVGTP